MDNRKNEIKGIITEWLTVFLYLLLLFAATVIIMR
jgi:hypothetical protein